MEARSLYCLRKGIQQPTQNSLLRASWGRRGGKIVLVGEEGGGGGELCFSQRQQQQPRRLRRLRLRLRQRLLALVCTGGRPVAFTCARKGGGRGQKRGWLVVFFPPGLLFLTREEEEEERGLADKAASLRPSLPPSARSLRPSPSSHLPSSSPPMKSVDTRKASQQKVGWPSPPLLPQLPSRRERGGRVSCSHWIERRRRRRRRRWRV